MSKVEIDYSNTIIYKITCKDINITDVYVGHTTNFVQRKYAHKQNCIKDQCKLYTTIRNNGGWENWTMEMVSFFNCKDKYEARQKEQECFELLHATLNSIQPMSTPKFISDIETPILCCENLENNIKQFSCINCNYYTNRKNNLTTHFTSSRHKQKKIKNELNQNLNNSFNCDVCNKIYKTNSGLWKHKKTCIKNVKQNNIEDPVLLTTNSLIMELIKDNKDMKQLLLEQGSVINNLIKIKKMYND